jgi:site-specific DNA-methyltransferase (adenine-specific)/adenine-specific DNA-methyltransferase
MKNDQARQVTLQLATSDNGVASVEKYEFSPIKGYPMLNWRGKRPFTSTQYYPAQLKELHGQETDGWRNKIFWGDNLQVMSHLLKEFRAKIDLIYIDPPFDSGADYRKKVVVKGTAASGGYAGFEEKQYGDIWNNDEYLQFMYERLVLLRELLTSKGTIYLHCDHRRGHHLKCILDEVFGSENCITTITWKRSTAHSDSKQGRLAYGDISDVIHVYSKTSEYTFNTQYVPYTQEYIDKYYRYKDQDGRRYWLDNLQAPGGAAKGNPYYEVMGVSRYWRYSKAKMAQLIEAGRVIQTAPGRVPQFKRYLDEMPGVPLQNIWDDINRINPVGNERLGYPTQKPEALLQRIIEVSSNPGEIVFDCFMGSGTTQAAAMSSGRRFVGADINLGAVQLATKRLIKDIDELRQGSLEEGKRKFVGFEIFNVNHYDVFRNPLQAKELLLEALEVQKLEMSSVFDGEKDGRMVKIMPVNRIATRADLNELIAGFDYKTWERRQNDNPNRPVEKLALVCMGHEPDLRAQLELAAQPFKIDVEVVDILRDKSNLEFNRDSEAKVAIQKGVLIIERFFPMNLLQKLSLQKESVEDWREMVESILIDWNYDGAVLQPSVVDIPAKDDLVQGAYKVPDDAGTIRVKITDLLSESWEGSVVNG